MARGTKTTDFLKECMADALLKLMKDRDIDKITVTEITSLAGVGRSTWFRHFAAKPEALTFKLVALWRRWSEERNIKESQRFNLENSRDFFMFNYNNRDLLKKLYATGLQTCIYDAFCIIMMPQYDATLLERYQSRFYAYGVFGLLGEWVARDFRETPDEMVDLFYRVMDDRSTL
mgnify:FL=1